MVAVHESPRSGEMGGVHTVRTEAVNVDDIGAIETKSPAPREPRGHDLTGTARVRGSSVKEAGRAEA